jgi:hypothetical protein
MKKFWIVYGHKNYEGRFTQFDSYDEAEIHAKRQAHANRENDFIIMEAVAITMEPIPDINVVKL